MFGTKSDGCDGGKAVGVRLLISASAGAGAGATSSGKYGRLWRRSLIVGFFIACKKNTRAGVPLPLLSVPLLLEQEADEVDESRSVSQCVIVSDHGEIEEDEQQLLHSNELSDDGEKELITEGFHLEKGVDAASHDQESSGGYGFLKFLLKVISSLGNSSIKDRGDLSTPHVALPTPPPTVEEQFLNSDIKEEIVRIVKEKDLHSLRKFGGVERIASVLGSDLETGITGDRNPQSSSNDNPVYAKGFFHFLMEACNSFTILLLLISAGLSYAVEIIEQGLKFGWHDGTAILVAVFLLVIFPSVSNFRQSRKALLKKKKVIQVKVVSGGQLRDVSVSDIVLGDVVHLKKGDIVPADGLFINGNSFGVEKMLNAKTDRHCNPFLFSGSKVIEGKGCMLVTSEVAKSSLAEILSLVKHDPNSKTLMEDQIDKPNSYIDNLALCVSLLIAVVVLVRVLCKKHGNDDVLPELKGKVSVKLLFKIFQKVLINPRGTISILTSSLSAIVIGFQHGMPFVITISLSYWKEKFDFQAKFQNLSACCTVGIVTVICIEATCGLVYNEVEVDKFYIGEEEMNSDVEVETNQGVLEALRGGLHMPEISCSSIFSWANSKFNLNMEFPDQSFDVIDYRNLSCNNRGIAVGVLMRKGEDEKLWLHWKGAASMILDMCSHYCDNGGEIHSMENQKEKFELVIKDMEDRGLRPIAFAYSETEVQEIRQHGLKLLALVGLKYQCTEETKSIVEALRNCGISIKLVSEDEVSVLKAIASELGFFRRDSDNVALVGEEFREMDINTRMQVLNQLDIIGSAFSSDKLIVVQCLQKQGHVVAFFGGSTSGIPALIETDLGITEQTMSTEMARESCDIVILGNSNNLGSLNSIIKSSRCVYQNIQKFTQVQLCCCISGLLIIFVSTIFVKDSPLTAIQLIWVNFVMFILGCPMMVLEIQHDEPSWTDQLNRRSQSLITKDMWKNIFIQVLCQALVLLVFLFFGQTIFGKNKNVVQPMIFNAFILCQIFNQFNAIDLMRKQAFVVIAKSYSVLIALVGVIVTQVLVIEYGTSLANCVRLNEVQWSLCLVIAAIPWVLDCVVKSVLISIPKRSCGFVC